MIYSSSSIYASEIYGDSFYFLKRHLLFVFIGILLASAVLFLDYRSLQRISHPLVFISFALLILVLIPGIGAEISGARRWFRLFGLSFQPSEFSQLALIIYISDFLSRKRRFIDNFYKGLLPAIIILGATCFLVLLQPDLGTAFAISFIVFLMLFISGANTKQMAGILLLGLIALLVLIFSAPYRRARMLAFINPWADPQGSGFQIVQAQIALGSGGFFGVGLGLGKGKLFYLPAAHTDFIFSIIGEELGILGTLSIIWLYLLFFIQGLKIIRFCREDFGRLISIGIVFLLSFKVMINLGVNLGLLPTKGLPLPFISYGGTSLIIDMAYVALLLNVSRISEEI